jgi:hypothetical protein
MRESNRNLDIPPPPGIPGEFACLVFEEGGNLTFFLVEGGEFAYGVGNLNFSFKHMCWIQNGVNDNGWVQVRRN